MPFSRDFILPVYEGEEQSPRMGSVSRLFIKLSSRAQRGIFFA